MSDKSCRICNKTTDISNFSKDSAKKDGLRSVCKQCDSRKSSLWAKKNIEKHRIKSKKASAKYKAKNPEKTKNDNKKFRLKNPEYSKIWAKENLEKVKKARDKYYYNNVEKTLERNRRRKARLRNNGFEPYTEKDVLEKYGTLCYLCNKEIDMSAPRWTKHKGWEQGLHIEHVIDIALGGPDCLENVRPSHGICNLTKNKGE